MIRITQHPPEHTRTPSNGCKWLARCTVDGVDYEASSRRGASIELARVLVAAGIPDQPVEVWDQDGAPRGRQTNAPSLRWPSLHKMAGWTYKESDQPLRRARWYPAPDLDAVFGVSGEAQNRGEAGEDGVSYPAAAE